MVTDLSNEIGISSDWDYKSLRSPSQPETPQPKLVEESVPIALGKPMAVQVPVDATGRTDSFIDDLIRVFLDTPEAREREPLIVPLAIHVTCRPHAGEHEPVPRRPLLSEAKLIAEGTPAEVQIVLGWDLDTHRLLLLLPFDKHTAWLSDLGPIVESRRVTFGELETVLGRLNHAGYIIPLARHFLSRLQHRLRSRKPKRQQLTLTQPEIEDIALWAETFLPKAHAGISLNQMTLRQPTRIIWSDSCPFGMGGFHLSGRAWRFPMPCDSPLLGHDPVNNVLEFLAMVVNTWLLILDLRRDGLKQDCILALGDNTSAIGWLFRSGKLPSTSWYAEPVQMIARKLAQVVMDTSHCLASQHLQGEHNVVANLLSYSGSQRGSPHPLAPDYPDDRELTNRFHSVIPQLIPKAFDISPLPRQISSFVTQTLLTTESSWIQSRNRLTKTETESGGDGSDSAGKPVSTQTTTSQECATPTENLLYDPSSPSTEELNGTSPEPMLASVRERWWRRLCATPQAIWVRRSGTVTNKVPFTSRTAPSSSLPFVHS